MNADLSREILERLEAGEMNIGELAERMGLPREEVKREVRHLVKNGWMESVGERDGLSVYRVTGKWRRAKGR